ncbi:MAG: response regulator [Pontiellaceae bacterium]|nr:response regulator [Pontiellaceae bacterium]MBN2784045.1 response regulator [Pontiellaceae bacterium]
MANILIIDDDPSIRNVFTRYLEHKGYSVTVASDGSEGLSILSTFAPDLVITDVMMPGKDGLEVVLELRKTRQDIPVFAISGGMRMAVMDFLPMIKKFGAKKVFYKPVDLDELLVAIHEQLGVPD